MPSPDRLVVLLAQANPHVGDVAGNLAKLQAAMVVARDQGADLVVTPELYLAGYPADDLVLKPAFVRACMAAIDRLAAHQGADGPGLLVGTPWLAEGRLYNAAVLIDRGRVQAVRYKHELPNYGVFDDKRLFVPGDMPGPMAFRGVRLGVMICEDMWFAGVAETLEESGAQMLIVLNGSPFEQGKGDERLAHAVARVRETGLALLYVNQVGGQDELVFDGASFGLTRDCGLAVQAPSFQESLIATHWRLDADDRWALEPGDRVAPDEGDAALWQALVLGLRDYVRKNRFPGVVLGLSGGIDSAIAAAIAVDALGRDAVHCVMMPSRYTSQDSLDDAAAAAALLGVSLDTIAIEPAVETFSGMLASHFAGRAGDITEENLQSRIRGVTLMALSNKFGWMVLSTGNKSEMAVGYATLYGDMCGGFAVLKDLYKMQVFALARWRNANRPASLLGPDGPVMPDRIITKPPTAELRANQTDQDSLPPYPVLDGILAGLIEGEQSLEDLVGLGYDRATVVAVWRLLDRAEYKRKQSPPGVKVTRHAFGRERRYPITNGFQVQS